MHCIVALLISLAVGYWLLTLAEKENGLTKILGRVIAGIIIVVSLLAPICMAACALCRHSLGAACGYSMRHHWNGGGWQGNRMWAPGMMGHKGMMPGPDSGEDKGTTNGNGSTDDKANSK